MKKNLILLLLLCAFGVVGCSIKGKIHGQYQNDPANQNQSVIKNAVKEEEGAFENRPVFLQDADAVIKDLIEKNKFLVDTTNKEYYKVKEKNGAFTIGVGNVGTNKIDIIAFDIKDNKLASNKKLKKEVLESVKTIMISLGAEYEQEVLINAIDNLDIGNTLENINYSEDINIYMAREKSYFDIRIAPEHKNE